MSRQRWLHLRRVAVGLLMWAALGEAALADFVVSPGPAALREGNLNSGFPFNLPFFGLTAMRYQEVYSSGDFASLGGPVYLTQLAFRPDATNGNAFTAPTFTNTQISLSTTPKVPDGLSTRFNENLGSNTTLVFSGSLVLSSRFTGPAEGPKAFDVLINLQTPFLYDPAQGNLLLELRTLGQTALTSELDAESVVGDGVSRLYSTDNNANATSGFQDTLGLVTRFTASPVPQPSSLVLLGLGTLALLVWHRRLDIGTHTSVLSSRMPDG